MTDVLSTQQRIADELQVPAAISGGVDSTTAGRLCQLAAERARAAGHPATFVAMRLPYGVQADEHHAQAALSSSGPTGCSRSTSSRPATPPWPR